MKSRERQQVKVNEARRIIAKLTQAGVMLSEREREFVTSMEGKLKRASYVSGRQLGWLRALELQHWGVSELERAVGRE